MTRPFRGWFVVAGAFLVMFTGFGAAYSFSAFLDPVQRAFGASRGATSLVFSIAGFLYFALGVVGGPLADRFSSRAMALVGMMLVGGGLIACGLARSLDALLLAYAIGIGVGVGLAYVPVVGAVQRWFVRRRGFASGMAVSGIGLGTLLVPPVAAASIAAFGWRDTYVGLGVFTLVFGIAGALMVDNDPRARGLGPDGDPPDAGAPRVTPGMAVREAVRTRAFVLLYTGCLVGAFGLFVPFVHLVPYAVDHGLSAATGTLLIGAIGVGSTLGRFLVGGWADRVGRERALTVMFVGLAASLLLWSVSTGAVLLTVFALVYGTCYGGYVALAPALIADWFGGRRVSALIGVLYTSVALGTLVGPAAAGFAYDRTGSYLVPILAGAAANLIGAAILVTAARSRRFSRPA